MTSARIRVRLANIALMLGALAVALLAAEAAVRLFWENAPASVARADSLPLQQIRDPEILYRLVPGSSGHYNGTDVSVNSLGLRDRELAIPKPRGVRRILVLGDSMVFGVGLPASETLSAQLTDLMRPDEAINAGVFGYNLAQEITLLRDIGLTTQPDLVVACFVHNDIENWGLGQGGAVPEIKSSRFSPPPAGAWSTRLADMMVPAGFDAERANLLPVDESAAGPRGWLASTSRLYLFTYLRLRTHSWSLTGGEERDPLVDTPSCQTDELIWQGLRTRFRALRSMVEGAGARLVVVIHGGLLWEGGPAGRLRDLLSGERMTFLDLSPVWLDRNFYAGEYSLGWDPHPNARANKVAAELIRDHLRRLPGGEPGPHDVIAARPDLSGRLEQWRTRQAELVEQEKNRWVASTAKFLPAVDLGGGDGQGQILYGFWEAESGPAYPRAGSGTRGGRWMSPAGSVLLKRPAGSRRVMIELANPEYPAVTGVSPDGLNVTFGAPPGRCGITTVAIPVHGAAPGPGDPPGSARVYADLPESLAGAELIEIGLSVDRAFPATYLHPDRSDPRLVSFFIRRVAIE